MYLLCITKNPDGTDYLEIPGIGRCLLKEAPKLVKKLGLVFKIDDRFYVEKIGVK